MSWVELRIVLTIFIMLIVPGWAILSVTNLWRRFEAIERWILAVGLSIAFYPILYYLTRALLPSLRMGQNKLIVLLAGLFALTVWLLRKSWREQFKLGKYAGPLLFILALTLLTCFWLAHISPYPAWIDANLPREAGFFINTTQWGFGISRGVDSGAWILPLSGRWTVAPTLFYTVGKDMDQIKQTMDRGRGHRN